MRDFFHILANDDNTWFQLVVTDRHFVISAVPTLDEILQCLEKIVIRYKTKDKLLRAIDIMETSLKQPQSYTDFLATQYLERGTVYDGYIDETVSKALITVRTEYKKHSPLAAARKRLATRKPLSMLSGERSGVVEKKEEPVKKFVKPLTVPKKKTLSAGKMVRPLVKPLVPIY